MLYYENHMFKANGKLPLVYLLLISIVRLIFDESGRLLFSIFIINQYFTSIMFLLQILWNFRKIILFTLLSKWNETSANGFLIYSSNIIRLPWATAIDLTEISILFHLNVWDFSFGSSELIFQFRFIQRNKFTD